MLFFGVLTFTVLWAAPLFAGPATRWTLDMVLGHDDQVMADPDIGVVAPVSEAYFTGSSRLRLRWADATIKNRLDLTAEASGTVYGDGVDGDDVDHRLTAAYRRRLSSRLVIDASTAGWRFRRGETSVFDFDLVRAGGRLAWAPHRSWLVAAGARHNEISFRERLLSTRPDQNENQHQDDVFLGMVCNLGFQSFVGAEYTYRTTISDEPRSEYGGPLAILRAGTNLPGDIGLSLLAVYARRNYDSAPALAWAEDDMLDTLGVRTDDTWQFGVTLSRPLNPQVSVFLDGTMVRQDSNDGFVGFDQARVAVGLQMDLLAPPRRGALPGTVARPSPITPVVTPKGMRFRCPAPGATGVSVVGGFNGWDPVRHPLSGPDQDGVWEVVIPLTSGIWRYAFVVDGEWVEPVDAPRYEDDGFGGRNGVVEVPLQIGVEDVTGSASHRQTSSEEPCP